MCLLASPRSLDCATLYVFFASVKKAKSMFKCFVRLEVPLKPKGQQLESPIFWQVAEYDYDPGLQVGDEVQVTDWRIGYHSDKPVTFIALVTKRSKHIKPQKPQDAFEISIHLEMADKDELSRIVEIFKKLNPGDFEDELY